MKKKLREFTVIALSLMLMTPVFTAPKLPLLPSIKVNVPTGATEAAKKAGAEAVKGLKIDWSKLQLNLN